MRGVNYLFSHLPQQESALAQHESAFISSHLPQQESILAQQESAHAATSSTTSNATSSAAGASCLAEDEQDANDTATITPAKRTNFFISLVNLKMFKNYTITF